MRNSVCTRRSRSDPPPPGPWTITAAMPLLDAQSTMRPTAHSTRSDAQGLNQALYPLPTRAQPPCLRPNSRSAPTHLTPHSALAPTNPTPTLFNP